MNKLLVIFFLLIFFSEETMASDSIPNVESTRLNEYFLQYSVNEKSFDENDSIIDVKHFIGQVQRNSSYVYFKKDSEAGIFKDSTIFLLDKENKIIILGPKRINGTFLLVPFYDPFEIIAFSEENKNSVTKIDSNKNFIYTFSFSDSIPIYNITIYFDSQHMSISSSFCIKIVYQRSGIKIIDTIDYKPTANFKVEKIEDYLELKNGKFEPKAEYRNYDYYNSFGLW